MAGSSNFAVRLFANVGPCMSTLCYASDLDYTVEPPNIKDMLGQAVLSFIERCPLFRD